MKTTLHVDNSFVSIMDPLPRDVLLALSDYCSYTVDGAYFSPAFQSGKWDGRKRLFSMSTYKFPSGLLPGVLKEGIIPDPIIKDMRVRPKKRIESKWIFPHPLRDYQEEAVGVATKTSRGILNISTGGGKTVIAMRIAHLLGVKTLIIVNTKEAFKDTVDTYNASIQGDPVGMWGAGKKKSFGRFVTVATMASVVKAFDNKDPSFTSQNFQCVFYDECLDGDTLISVPGGVKKLSQVKIGDVVLTPKGSAKVKKVWVTRKKAYRVRTRSGSLIGSGSHIVPYLHGDQKSGRVGLTVLGEADHLLIPVALKERLSYDRDEYLYGWFLGDGTCDRGYIKFGFRKDIENLRRIFTKDIFKESLNSRGDTIFTMRNEYAKNFIKKFSIKSGAKTRTVEIVDYVLKSRSVGVVKGLFDAEGCRTKSRIALDMTSGKCVRQLSQLLELSGIRTAVHYYKRDNPLHGDRARLCIYGQDINKFNTLYGFEIDRKNKSEPCRNDYLLYDKERILEKEDVGVKELYDIELDDEDRLFIANGYVVHNCHHLGSDTWFKSAQTLDAYYKFGLTGTNFRNGGSKMLLKAATGKTLIEVKAKALQEQGHLAQCEIVFFEVEAPYNIDRPMEYKELYDIGITNNKVRNDMIVKIAGHHKGDVKLITVESVEHGNALLDLLKKVDSTAVFVHGKTANRDKIKDMFVAGKLRTVIATRIYNESADIPILKIVINAAGGKSGNAVLQRLGRQLRLYEGKDSSRMYDFHDLFNYKMEQHSTERIKWLKKEGHAVKITKIDSFLSSSFEKPIAKFSAKKAVKKRKKV